MTKTKTINIEPFSINKAWAGRRFKTPAYKAWREEIAWKLGTEDPLDGPLMLTVKFFVKNRRSDGDNLIKPLLDALEGQGYFNNDNQFYKYDIEKVIVKNKCDERIEFMINQV